MHVEAVERNDFIGFNRWRNVVSQAQLQEPADARWYSGYGSCAVSRASGEIVLRTTLEYSI
jgi:hypothetical protein